MKLEKILIGAFSLVVLTSCGTITNDYMKHLPREFKDSIFGYENSQVGFAERLVLAKESGNSLKKSSARNEKLVYASNPDVYNYQNKKVKR